MAGTSVLACFFMFKNTNYKYLSYNISVTKKEGATKHGAYSIYERSSDEW